MGVAYVKIDINFATEFSWCHILLLKSKFYTRT